METKPSDRSESRDGRVGCILLRRFNGKHQVCLINPGGGMPYGIPMGTCGAEDEIPEVAKRTMFDLTGALVTTFIPLVLIRCVGSGEPVVIFSAWAAPGVDVRQVREGVGVEWKDASSIHSSLFVEPDLKWLVPMAEQGGISGVMERKA